ncbi:uncharacterized protein LY79DRAFT_667434 [Colletotrichum navitas]|uniref:Uncharacterized protein n=1 Tax=Colletotrichum navitas TaxID=681940 RepID=A0AAD8Q5T1_9PEZI|nr:uncharacterized protein LY79DRAFT_667434 [Colletotrichum navitas]KAK1596423.1 hypothetical protein LY79DRAFT_667434 [Colletotrichum navitas]
MPKGELSPILPHFDMITPPPPARLQPNPDDDVFGPSHEPKYSPMSFHLPRKPSASPSTTTASDTPPRIPLKSRARSHTSSSTEMMKERIACAMLEVDKLQHEIDLVMRRQSCYTNSRPSTSHSTALTMHEGGSLPTVPALPPAAPSFAERLNPGVERPHTAPQSPGHIPRRGMVFGGDDTAAFITPPRSRGRETRPPPPPLPLVLRPPLRKKKSFSRVSSWLFPSGAAGQHHQRSISSDSITNFPRPVKDREGFYQCVQAPRKRRASIGSMSTASTSESDDGCQTVPTAWSPSSTLATRTDELPMERHSTFGKENGAGGSRGTNFAVAF